MTEAEIPVMGHVGLTPQSIRRIGRYKVSGAGREDAARRLRGALDLERAGAFAVVLESIPMAVAGEITAALTHPDHRHRRRAPL